MGVWSLCDQKPCQAITKYNQSKVYIWMSPPWISNKTKMYLLASCAWSASTVQLVYTTLIILIFVFPPSPIGDIVRRRQLLSSSLVVPLAIPYDWSDHCFESSWNYKHLCTDACTHHSVSTSAGDLPRRLLHSFFAISAYFSRLVLGNFDVLQVDCSWCSAVQFLRVNFGNLFKIYKNCGHNLSLPV